jgi:hypothetical protein
MVGDIISHKKKCEQKLLYVRLCSLFLLNSIGLNMGQDTKAWPISRDTKMASIVTVYTQCTLPPGVCRL